MSIPRHPAYKWLVVGMLWWVCFFNYADRQAIFSLFPLLKLKLHLSDVQLGVVGSAFMWMYAISGPVAGWLCDRLPRKTLILGGLFFWSVVTAATAISHNYLELTICRLLGGLGEAFYFPASMSLISDYHGPSTRSRAMSLHQSSVYAGSIAGGAVSGFVGQFYGWQVSFVLFGLLGVALSLVLWLLLSEPVRGMAEQGTVGAVEPKQERDLLAALFSTLGNLRVIFLIAVFIGANFVAVVFLTWMPTFLYRKFHMSLSMAGLNGTAYLQIASVLGVLVGGFLADAAVKRSWHGGRMITQSIGLFLGVPFLFLVGWTATVPIVIVAMTGFGFFKGIYDANIWASLYDVVPAERRGTAVGVMNSLGWLGGGGAPILIALASKQYGMGTCISATAAIYLCCGLLLLWCSRIKREENIQPLTFSSSGTLR